MHTKSCVGCMLTLLGLWAVPAAQAQILVPVDPTTTYLHTNQDTGGDNSPILLSSLVFNGHSLQAGDMINLTETGDFLLSIYDPNVFETGMVGVFSSNNVLLDSSLLNRVPGAIEAGVPYVTLPTYFGNQPTDIPEDFFIEPSPGTSVTIPTGANYLFLSADDDLFGDNANPHNNFGVQISYVPSLPVPEASTTTSFGLLLALGLGGLVIAAKRKKASAS